MSAGVGKTYTMLSDAVVEKNRGKDVVAGYVEPHGRVETEGLVDNFEVLPTITVTYRNISVKEFDLEGALKRKPEILLVDELAHSNAPGQRHAKRWQDVIELVEAGIDVHTTLNIQHLESLNDVIAGITGVEVKETVPDSILSRANKIELIDIPPDELIVRLKEGKIYPKEKVATALENFFQEGNLLALRELSLRKAAEKIDADILEYRSLQAPSESWGTNERVLVAVAPTRFAKRLIRSAARVAARRHAQLIAVAVDTPQYELLREQAKAMREEALLLAEKLGAAIERRSGSDIVTEILTVAQEHNVSLIVVGKPVKTKLREVLFGSVADDLIRRSGRIDVHLITGDAQDAATVPIIRRHKPKWASIVSSIVTVFMCSALCQLLRQLVEPSNLVMIYLLGVVFVSSRSGRAESILAAFLSVLCFDFFFIEPRFSFSVSDAQYVITFIVMLITALLLSTLTLRVRLQAQAVGARERATRTLYEFGKFLLTAQDIAVINKEARRVVMSICGRDACIFVTKGTTLSLSSKSDSQFELTDSEFAVARLAAEKNQPTGVTTDTLPGSLGLYLPFSTAKNVCGVLGIAVDSKPLTASERGAIELLVQQIAIASEKKLVEEEAYESRLHTDRESLRTTLLSSLSHDLRTPLTTILGSATALLDTVELSAEQRRTLTGHIISESRRLGDLVKNMMDIAKLELGEVALRKEWNDIEELLASALDKTESALQSMNVTVNKTGKLPLVFVDGVFIEQVFINVLENIAHHAKTATQVLIGVTTDSTTITITIADNGIGAPLDVIDRLFEKGFTTRSGTDGGMGLGLALAKRVITLHGGTITAANASGSGMIFTITLPLAVEPDIEDDERN